MTESLGPKYIGLLVWVLGIYGTRLLPAGVEDKATIVAVIGFVTWFVRESQRASREVQQYLVALAARKGGRRNASAVASPPYSAVRREA